MKAHQGTSPIPRFSHKGNTENTKQHTTMSKQKHIAVSEEFKNWIQDQKSNFAAPSATKDSLEMSEREFCNAIMHTVDSLKCDTLATEAKRELALRSTRTRRSASVAEVEALKAQREQLIAKLEEKGMTKAEIAAIVGDDSDEDSEG